MPQKRIFMEKEAFSDMLLDVLKDSKVSKKVQQLLAKTSNENDGCLDNAKKISEYTDKLKKIREENEILKTEIDDLKTQLRESNGKVSDLDSRNKKLQKDNDKLKNENSELNAALKPFAKICKMLDAYTQIPPKVKDSVKNLLGKGSPEELISCSLRQGNLENLWESGRVLAMRQEYSSAKTIGVLLEIMIELYEKFNSSAKMLSVRIGENFDDRKHIHCENKNRVKITEVLLPGLLLKETVSLKAIVR